MALRVSKISTFYFIFSELFLEVSSSFCEQLFYSFKYLLLKSTPWRSLKFSHLFQLQHILSQLGSLSAGWTLEENSFVSSTPKGKVTFTNVLAVLDPSAPRRVLLACHHDSKILPADPKNPKRVFVGASDSAIPCAMILELATALDTQLKALKLQVDLNHEEQGSSWCFLRIIWKHI